MSRSRKTFAAYVNDGDEVLVQHSSDKYDYVGLVNKLDGTGQWNPVAYGYSKTSVIKRTRTVARRELAPSYRDDWSIRTYSCVAMTWEVTAPVIEKYFGHHRLAVTAVFKPGEGWKNVADIAGEPGATYRAGRSTLRWLAEQGYTGIYVRGVGNIHRLRERGGLHQADFQMDEVLKSMNSRKKA